MHCMGENSFLYCGPDASYFASAVSALGAYSHHLYSANRKVAALLIRKKDALTKILNVVILSLDISI